MDHEIDQQLSRIEHDLGTRPEPDGRGSHAVELDGERVVFRLEPLGPLTAVHVAVALGSGADLDARRLTHPAVRAHPAMPPFEVRAEIADGADGDATTHWLTLLSVVEAGAAARRAATVARAATGAARRARDRARIVR